MTESLHYACENDEVRLHKCGGVIILKESRGNRFQPFCSKCMKFLNIQQTFMESVIKKIEEVAPQCT